MGELHKKRNISPNSIVALLLSNYSVPVLFLLVDKFFLSAMAISSEMIGKKIYHLENKVGEVVGIKLLSRKQNKKVVIIETTKNDYKAAPVEFFTKIHRGLKLQHHKDSFDNFPAMSNKDIENETDNFYNALTEHYGEPDHWQKADHNDHDDPNQAYMGSEISNPPLDNESPKDEVDYDKLKGGKE